MNSFVFQTTKTVINEPGVAYQLADHLKELGINKPIVITDPGLEQLGMLKKMEHGLNDAGMQTVVFSRVLPDPPADMILQALQEAMDHSIDGVIGFGGGSSLDTAKLVAFLANSKQQLSEIYGVGQAKGSRLPLVLIPTTSGTGSEVTPIAIVTTTDSQKMGVVSPLLYPDIAVLDAELTLGLPPMVTAATGIDAMVHAIEAYTTKTKKNPLSDMLAVKALDLLSKNILTAVTKGKDLEARSGMLLGSMLAGQAFANAPVAAVHALAYPVGGHFHVPHGLSNSLMLPHVMRFNQSTVPSQYAELARVILPPDSRTGADHELSNSLIDWLEELIGELGLQTKLSQVGVSEGDLAMLAEDALKQERLLVNNPREMTYADALSIYRYAF